VPIRPPALDDRRFADLVDELLARVPAHVPEWSDPRVGDPGRTLIELFAWLGDTLLYRANLVPEKQRLQFLRLLGLPLRAAVPARGLIALAIDDDDPTPVALRAPAAVEGPVGFETVAEISVQPVTAACYVKRRPSADELGTLGAILDALPKVYQLGGRHADYYVTTPVFAEGAIAGGVDLVRDAVDASLWIALLAADADAVPAARAALGGTGGVAQLLNVGWAPAIEAEAVRAEVGRAIAVPYVFELTSKRDNGELDYLPLEQVVDSSQGLTRRGVVRLVMPAESRIWAPDADEDDPLRAGVGDRPPRLDDVKLSKRVVAWLRLRPRLRLDSLRASWFGVNAVEIDQRRTTTARVFGASNGQADQEHKLPAESIDPATLRVQIEDAGAWVTWRATPDLALADRDDEVYQLDAEAGTIRFGDGVRGRIPPATGRLRVEIMRAGGGAGGNLPAGTLRALDDPPAGRRLTVTQALPTIGGQDAETLVEAERRIPGWLRHRDRAVTAGDFRAVAAETPGVALGRVEVLPQFKPQQRRSGVPGVVSVAVWPQKAIWQPPNPRADQPLIAAVTAWLDERRPLATELYVMGCEYVPVAASAGVQLREGAPRDEVLAAVRDALRRFLWPLFPGGADATGWPLGRAVRQRELEVVVAQVPGVAEVVGVNLFERNGDRWVRSVGGDGNAAIALERWQLPELLAVTAEVGEPHDDPDRIPNPYGTGGVAIPVVPEVC
jgi:hypothetical protein